MPPLGARCSLLASYPLNISGFCREAVARRISHTPGSLETDPDNTTCVGVFCVNEEERERETENLCVLLLSPSFCLSAPACACVWPFFSLFLICL